MGDKPKPRSSFAPIEGVRDAEREFEPDYAGRSGRELVDELLPLKVLAMGALLTAPKEAHHPVRPDGPI